MSGTLFLERHEQGQNALLLQVRESFRDDEDERQEFASLARAAGAHILAEVDAPVKRPHPATLVGGGKVEAVADAVRLHNADLVLVSKPLSPIQERNLEQAIGCRVLDRTTLILDIFAQRARSHEGKLQVELAQLKHMSTRLVRGWTHLERQRGGIGLRGPGETQLETDRRLIAARMRMLNQRLEKLQRTWRQGRRARKRAGLPIVSLVGYTNAGKSTLFNRMTGAGVVAVDQLFATLDTTLRRASHPQCDAVILSDTVGFVRDLPHELVAAFRATLQESRDADLLLHVIDSSDPAHRDRMEDVKQVLEVIEADTVPTLLVYNKIDNHPEDKGEMSGMERDSAGRPRAVWVSAVTGQGIEDFWLAIGECLGQGRIQRRIHVPYAASALRARLFELGVVTAEQADQSEMTMAVDLSTSQARELARMPGIDGQVASRELLSSD